MNTQQASPSAAALRFGALLSRWCQQGGWCFDTFHKWGNSAGFEPVRSMTFLKLQRGELASAPVEVFAQLAECNRRLAERDYGEVGSERLLRILQGIEPLRDCWGRPWGAAEFSGYFLGESLEDPLQYRGQAWQRSQIEMLRSRVNELAASIETLSAAAQLEGASRLEPV